MGTTSRQLISGALLLTLPVTVGGRACSPAQILPSILKGNEGGWCLRGRRRNHTTGGWVQSLLRGAAVDVLACGFIERCWRVSDYLRQDACGLM